MDILQKDFTEDSAGLLDVMQDIYHSLPNSGTQNRCTRIVRKLKSTINTEGDSENESEKQDESEMSCDLQSS